ncbi:hypothetical protein ACH4SK_43680 [Streptomyces inhibens]|uniref:hypothetical protein n=1 Tax=Streptomyces inhibens TaxID=2293571 RepID=UPI0037A8A6BE
MRVVPCTGDWAVIDFENGRVGDHIDGVVGALLPRRTAFVRSTSSKRSEGQVLATDIDSIVICVSPADRLDLGRIERFLTLAMSGSTGEGPVHSSALSWGRGGMHTCLGIGHFTVTV